jgi:hypothetical protein
VVADKAAVKDLVHQLAPLLKVLGSSRKIVLTPLARYWVAPCCSDPMHTVNYRDAIAGLRDSIRDVLFVKKIQNFRVLCPNRMIGVGQRRQEPSDEEAAKAAAVWGSDPVHPTSAAYRVRNLSRRPPGCGSPVYKPYKSSSRYEEAPLQRLDRVGWVSRSSAALSRRDTGQPTSSRGKAPVGRVWTPSHRGQRANYRGRSSGGPQRGSHQGNGFRRFSGGRRGRSF